MKRNILSVKRLATLLAAFSPAIVGVGCFAEPAESDDGAVGAAESALTLKQLTASFTGACTSASLPAGFTNTSSNCTVSNFTRTVVDSAAAIYEYTADVAIGAGTNNVMRVHRVVREASQYTPAVSSDAVMLVHGDLWPFGAAFGDSGFARYLAVNGVDVWGVDLRWTQVTSIPNGDSSFMANWGMAQQSDDLGIALSIARWNRSSTGSSIAPMSLLGWSRGGQLGYAYLDKETLVPVQQRHASRFIPVDVYLRTMPNSAERTAACNRLADLTAQYATDEYYSILGPGSPLGAFVAGAGVAAIQSPNMPSSLNPNWTNRDFALIVGEATYWLQGANPVTPTYHFTGGTFDSTTGLPNGLTYTLESDWLDFMTKAAPYQPIQMMIDAERAGCANGTSTIDTHFGNITVPVLYVGADGGFGYSAARTRARSSWT
jgi:pimeloyl-ACP methyl ester carboxylesterase